MQCNVGSTCEISSQIFTGFGIPLPCQLENILPPTIFPRLFYRLSFCPSQVLVFRGAWIFDPPSDCWSIDIFIISYFRRFVNSSADDEHDEQQQVSLFTFWFSYLLYVVSISNFCLYCLISSSIHASIWMDMNDVDHRATILSAKIPSSPTVDDGDKCTLLLKITPRQIEIKY